ncbi:MAG: hypothetical protein ABII90_00480 [Bacteroidota bacterium]
MDFIKNILNFLDFSMVRNQKQFEAAASNMLLGTLVFIPIITIIAILIVNRIRYQSGAKPKDILKRRVVFFIFIGIVAIFYVAMGYFNSMAIMNPMFKARYMTKLYMNTGIAVGLYVVIFILASLLLAVFFNWYKTQTVFRSKQKLFGVL